MRGNAGPIDTVLDAPYMNIQQWGRASPNDGRVIIAADPLDNIGAPANTIGMGLTYAKAYAATLPSNIGVLLVPCAKGATGFSTNDWNPGNALYEDALARINAAVANNVGNVLKSILWHQGEQDAAYTQVQYATKLDAMLTDLRSRATGATTTPFICGGTLVGGTGTAAGVTAALIDTPNRDRYTAYASPAGLTDTGDNLHFNATSLRTFGTRYYAQLANAIANV